PVTAGSIVVPLGHVVGNEKWRGSELAQRLQGKVRLIFEDALGLVDFHLPNRTCILLISEADLVAGDEFKRRLVKFRNVTVERRSPAMGAGALGVADSSLWPQVREQSRDRSSNPFVGRQRARPAEPAVLQALQRIPGVGRTKALLLLQRFGSIHRLCNADIPELEQAVGQTVAQQIYTF
ncbi:FAP24 protein, partial [Emberiza fucata]|nr:FAP24 protein [Emberiza fucata]